MAMIDIDNWAEEELLTESERQELKNLDRYRLQESDLLIPCQY